MPTCSTERTRITCAVVLSPPSISTARVTSSRAISSMLFCCETISARIWLFISSCRPSVHKTSTSPGCNVSAVVSGETNISGPRERISTCRESDAATSLAEISPIFLCSFTHVWSWVICLAVPQSAGYQRCGHLFPPVLRGECAIVHRRVSKLDQPRQQADEHRSRLGLLEFLGQH